MSADGTKLFVVHPDADSVSIVDATTHAITSEVLLGGTHPAVDPTTSRFDPAVEPRALALGANDTTLYVTGERSGHVYAVDVASGTVKADVAVCSEPVGVVVSPDDAHVFVACSQDDAVVELSAPQLAVESRVACPRKPWGLLLTGDGKTLYATHLLGPGVSLFATQPFALTTTWTLADGPPATSGDPTEPHGEVRGIYDATLRPGSDELWTTHLMLGTDTSQPTLNFLRTVFPSVSILAPSGSQLARLSVVANPGDGQAFGDVVSGPRAIAFSGDGTLAFLVDTDSEDVLVIDAQKRVEATLKRPIPGHMPEGIVWSNGEVFVQERNTEDIAVFRVEGGDGGPVTLDLDTTFPTLASDPMPANLRAGQQLFYSANSDEQPITQDHWVSCAACHIEGRSSAVTWKVTEGPRDTPSNAGGMLGTGFLFRTADRSQVQDYWQTINIEQGGHFSITDPSQKVLLDQIADYVNYAIPVPVPPTPTDPQALARGEQVFSDTTLTNCTCCHSGPYKTDSGSGNPTLDLSGPIVLHDVGTCVTTGSWPDVAHTAINGDPRTACDFDTPALRGLWDSAPYLHDGSAQTLDMVVPIMLQATAPACPTPLTNLSSDDRAALVEYLRSL
jgi:YVTN family beta-propeller protein